jgi:fatty acid desaturase
MVNSAVDELETHIQSRSKEVNPHQILGSETLTTLNNRSNLKGWLQLISHLTIMAASGYLWATSSGIWWIAVPALVIYGFSFASMFAPMHECAHRTAFANNRVNDVVAWIAATLAFYNSTFYRRYHKWHHRYTQLPDKDPELSDPKPTSFKDYVLEISALPWWIGKVRGHLKVAIGQVKDYPFLPETAYAEVIRSTRLQLLTYGMAIAISTALGHPEFIVLYWVLPLAVGQPILRFILLAEHTGCTNDENPLTNTRTTLTLWPLRLMMWNMPFHAEHHLYPSIPFHALPAAHEELKQHFQHIEPGYIKVNQGLVATIV